MNTLHRASLALVVGILIPSLVAAKRIAPPKVEPVVQNGVRYSAPNDNGRRGYVEAWDVQTGKKLWTITVFDNPINQELEEDVQHEFIAKLSVAKGKLVIETERGRKYAVDLKTRRITELHKDKE